MNIKKVLILMALCCSISTSAMERSNTYPQEQEQIINTVTPTGRMSADELKQSVKNTASTIQDMLKLYFPESPQNPVEIINQFESFYAELTSYVSELRQACTDIDKDNARTAKEKFSHKQSLKTAYDAADTLWSQLSQTISDVLDNVPTFTGPYDKNMNTYLENAKESLSIASLLKDVTENKGRHKTKLLKYESDLLNEMNTGDSDQELNENKHRSKINFQNQVMQRRHQLLMDTLNQFFNVKQRIMDDIDAFSAKI